MNNNLLIVGAEELGYSAKEIAKASGLFAKIDFLDDNNDSAVGKLKDYENLSVDYSYAYPAFNDPEERINWIQKLEESCYKIPILVHPQAYISPSAQLRKGTIVEPMAIVKGNSSVGIGCIISAGAVIENNSFISDVCCIGSNSVVAHNTLVPAGTKILPCNCFSLNRELNAEDLFFKPENINGTPDKKRPQPHTPDVINGKVYSFEDGF